MATDPFDIQKKLDEWLAANPEAQKYVSKLYYVPEGTKAPKDATHSVVLASVGTPERHLMIAAVVVPEFATFLDMILALVATQPPRVD
jgi:hypothetical protein